MLVHLSPTHDFKPSRTLSNNTTTKENTTMKFNNSRRSSGYSATLANNILDASKPIHCLSIELEPQQKFEDKKPTGEIIAYKAWFTQSGLPPFEVKFLDSVKLPNYLAVVEFENLQAVEVSYNVYFNADGLKEVK